MGGIGFRLGGSPRRKSATVSCTQVSTRAACTIFGQTWTNCIFLVFLRRKKRGVTTENSLRPPGALDSSPIIGRTERAAHEVAEESLAFAGTRLRQADARQTLVSAGAMHGPGDALHLCSDVSQEGERPRPLGAMPTNEPDRRSTRWIKRTPTRR